MNQIQAVMIIIQKGDRFLLGKRSEWKKVAPGFWCPVSGKIELNETQEDAVCREALEEVGVKVKPLRKITEMDTRDGSGRLHWWLVEVLEGEAYLKNNEHSELGWFHIDEIAALTPSFHEHLAILRSLT